MAVMTAETAAPPVPSRGALTLLGLLVFLTVGYFQNSRPGWNVNSQFALTCAIAERWTVRIDAYHARPDMETGDKAQLGGHFYSDKSPVTAFLGVPAFWIYRHATRALGLPFTYDRARWWTTWWTIGLAAAALAAMLAVALARRGVAPGWALAGAGLWWLATPLLGYSILFFNYLPACALGLGGWMLVEPVWRPKADRDAPGMGKLAAGGALFGLAAWALPTMSVAALMVTAGLAWTSWTPWTTWTPDKPRINGVTFVRRMMPWAVGGLLGAAGYFIYLYAVFGSVSSPYRYEADPFFREHMSQGLMGAGWPRPRVALLLTVLPFQGLFLWFPVTLAAMMGLVQGWTRGDRGERLESAMALAIFAALLAYVSGYFMWWGGWSYAPRHLIPALPWMALGLAPWLRTRARGAILAVAGLGAIFNVAAVSLDPQPSPGLAQTILMQPERVSDWPTPFLQLQEFVWLSGQTDRNWGRAAGLNGAWSLLPLMLAWAGTLGGLAWMARREREGSRSAMRTKG
jgi:hypothetical protein